MLLGCGLEREWKSLAAVAVAEDRRVVLEMSVNFYKKAEHISYSSFCVACEA